VLASYVREVGFPLGTALWGYFGLPPKKLSAATYIFLWGSYMLSGAFYPEGSSFAISRGLEKTVKKYGGEILYTSKR